MKRIVALILALILCFSLCACGGDTQKEETTKPELSMEEQLQGEWWCLNYQFDMGKVIDFENGEWSWSSPNGTITHKTTINDKEEVTEYKVHGLGDIFVMVSGDRTYVHRNTYEANPDDFATKEIEITTDNWKDYYQIYTHTSETFDVFGEKTGEEVSYSIGLKHVYSSRVLYGKSEVKFRFGDTDIVGDSVYKFGFDQYKYKIEDPTELPDATRVEGKITILDFQQANKDCKIFAVPFNYH